MATLTGFNRRVKLTIASDTISLSGNLTDQAVAIHMDSTNTAFWANDGGNGTHVRFTSVDGITLLKFELESFDAVGEDAWWHVKIPTLTSGAATEIYLYYDAVSGSDGSDKESVWDSSYINSYHMNADKPEGFSDDSTANNLDMSTVVGTLDIAGAIDRGRDFDGIDDAMESVTGGMGALLNGSTAVTVEGTFKVDTLDTLDQTIYVGFVSGGAAGAFLFVEKTSDKIKIGGRSQSSDSFQSRITVNPISTGVTYHAVGVLDYTNDKARLYVDGVLEGTTNVTFGSNTFVDGNDQTSTDGIGSGLNATAVFLDGTIDEVTVSKGVRSTDWVRARNASRLGTWLSFGFQEALGTTGESTYAYEYNFG